MVLSEITLLRNRFDQLIDQAACWHNFDAGPFSPHKYLKLLIIDEADRLKPNSLEVIRDIYERTSLSIMLIGSSGFDKRLRRYSQLHDRLTLGYEIQPLNQDEMRQFISQKWKDLNLPLSADDAASIAIMRLSNGNLRALHHIFHKIKRLQKPNYTSTITPDLVEVARQGLLLGA